MKITCPACALKVDIRPYSNNNNYTVKYYDVRCRCKKFTATFERRPQRPIRLYEIRFKENYFYLWKKILRPQGLSEEKLIKFFKKVKTLKNFI